MPSLAELAFGPNVSGAIIRGTQGRQAITQLRDADQQRTRQQNIDRLFAGGIPDDPQQRQLLQDKAFALGGADVGFQVREAFQGMDQAQLEQEALEGRTVATFLAGVQDQAGYDRARAGLQGRGIDISELPEQFDPAHRDFVVNSARQLEDILKGQQPGEDFTLGPKQTRFDAQGREIARGRTPEGADAPSAQDLFKNANTLRDEFVKQTDNFAVAQRGLVKVQAAANDNTGAGDVALIFGFMKTIDPESTVREGEFATAENTGSIPERTWALWNSLKRGERLTPSQRQRFAATAESQFEAQRAAYDQTVAEYTRLAESFGLPPAQVIINRALSDDTDTTFSAPAPVETGDVQPSLDSMPRPTTQEGFDALPDGAWYIDPDTGQPIRKGR